MNSSEEQAMRVEIPGSGMSRTVDQLQVTLKTLKDSLPNNNMTAPLRDANDPLAALSVPWRERWWHDFSTRERELGEPDLSSYGNSKKPPGVKVLVIRRLDWMLAKAKAGGQVSPDAVDDAYKSPPRGQSNRKKPVWATDPDKVDRGTTAHTDTQDALNAALEKAGLKGKSPIDNPQFDIGWRVPNDGPVGYVTEVKSLTDENEAKQIRLAIGQVLDYVHTLCDRRDNDSLPARWQGVHDFKAVIALEHESAAVDHWMGLCNSAGIILTWPGKYDETIAAMLTQHG
jgi:hypothetical protein